MYPKALTLIFLLIQACPLLSGAQLPEISAWLEKLKTAQHDKDKADIYYAISRYYWSRDVDSALSMADQSLQAAEKAHYDTGVALALLSKGVAYGYKAQYPEDLQCHLKALRISEKLGMEGLMGNIYNNIGIVYSAMKDNARALEYYKKALPIFIHNKKDPRHGGESSLLINMSEAFKDLGKYDSAIEYNERALRIVEQVHDSMNLSVVLLNMGDDYVRMKQPGKALSHLTQALHISESLHDDEGIAWAYNTIAQAYEQQGQYNISIQYAVKSLKKGQDLHLPEIIKGSSHTLYMGYRGLRQFDLALDYRNREIAINDSLYTLEKEMQMKNLQSDYELEKKQHQIDLLNKDKTIRETEAAKEEIMRRLYIGMAVLLGLGCFFLYRSNVRNRRLNRKLEELNMVKNKLLSIIGHDLRSPIATLQGFVDLLRQSALSEEQIRHFSTQMNESLISTSNLLNNLLYWAKSQMEGMQVNARAIDVQSIIRQNKRLAQSRAGDKGVMLIADETAPPVMAYADEVMVDLVIRNLVENAVKFSGSGDTIWLSAAAGDNNVSITVKDTGQGIPAKDQYKIFHPSFSHTTTGTAREKGSGLGLSLCKELVEKNGGSIRFESESGKGAAFTFTLPLPQDTDSGAYGHSSR